MISQKDIHNIFVKCLTPEQKVALVKRVGGDVNALKKAEKAVTDVVNTMTEVFADGLDYLNKEI